MNTSEITPKRPLTALTERECIDLFNHAKGGYPTPDRLVSVSFFPAIPHRPVECIVMDADPFLLQLWGNGQVRASQEPAEGSDNDRWIPWQVNTRRLVNFLDKLNAVFGETETDDVL